MIVIMKWTSVMSRTKQLFSRLDSIWHNPGFCSGSSSFPYVRNSKDILLGVEQFLCLWRFRVGAWSLGHSRTQDPLPDLNISCVAQSLHADTRVRNGTSQVQRGAAITLPTQNSAHCAPFLLLETSERVVFPLRTQDVPDSIWPKNWSWLLFILVSWGKGDDKISN
jgi:hypothetical protein